MPAPRTKFAPKKFTGHYTEIEDFLETYERLCVRYNVTSGRDRCHTIRQYCSRNVVQVIEGLQGFNSNNWAMLKEEMKNLYDAERNEKRYTSKDLKKFVKKHSSKKITTKSVFKEYQRSFMTIGGWLRAKDKITETKQAKYFMRGIHKGFEQKLRNRLEIINPHKPVREPWAIDDIIKAAEYILERRKAERMEEISSGSEDDSDYSDSDSETDSDSDSCSVWSTKDPSICVITTILITHGPHNSYSEFILNLLVQLELTHIWTISGNVVPAGMKSLTRVT